MRPVIAGIGLELSSIEPPRQGVVPDAAQVGRNVVAGRTIRGTGRGRDPRGAKDGMVTIVSNDGVAHIATLPDTVKSVFLFAEIPATDKLAEITADGAHRPDMGRSRPAAASQGLYIERGRWD